MHTLVTTEASRIGASASITISPDLILHVRRLLKIALSEAGGSAAGRLRFGINVSTSLALPAYIGAVTAVDAFLHEVFLSGWTRRTLPDSPLWQLPSDWLEKVELKVKCVLVPQLLFGVTPSAESAPLQDLAVLIKLRNDVVHYKMQGKTPRYLKSLEDRGIALPLRRVGADSVAWPQKVSCSEGIRWAHNVACDAVHTLVNLIPLDMGERVNTVIVGNFEAISEDVVRQILEGHGVDPNSDFPQQARSVNGRVDS